MRRIVAALMLLPAAFSAAGAHFQHVHQYLVSQGYARLAVDVGGIPAVAARIGTLDSTSIGEGPWRTGFVTTGAWREDVEDPVFGYRLHNLFNNYSLVSISHFWDADAGDFTLNAFRVSPLPGVDTVIGPYENAYDKLLRYAAGGWVLWYPESFRAVDSASGHDWQIAAVAPPPPLPGGIPLSYEGVGRAYRTSRFTLRTDVQGSYTVFDLNTLRFVTPSGRVRLTVPSGVRDRICWEVVGRMCHLLADMSVPAHAHADEHGLDADHYEQWEGGAARPYLVWRADNAGPMIDPFLQQEAPLHYLMYTMQQQADHFGSTGPYAGEGDDLIGGEARPLEAQYLAGIPLPSLGPPTGSSGPWTPANLENILNRTFPYAVRATAGLLFWFAVEAGLVAPAAVGEPEGVAGGFLLEQNYPNPFNPHTVVRFALPGEQWVRLAVYDALGREVALLAERRFPEGLHTVRWDARDLAGGAYLIRLSAGGRSAHRKAILLR